MAYAQSTNNSYNKSSLYTTASGNSVMIVLSSLTMKIGRIVYEHNNNKFVTNSLRQNNPKW